MNPSQKMVTIYTTEPSKVILNSDTFHTVDNKVNIEVKRKKEPLKITAITDSLTKEFAVDPVNSFMYISLPHINSFQLSPENEGTKINTGFWGISLGLDYYHSKQQFINIGFSSVLDFFVPFPAPVDISGEHELMSSSYIGLSNNHKLGRIALGYGLSYARNSWDFRYYDMFDPPPPTRVPVKKSHHSFGLIFPTYLQLGDLFNIGGIYRPTFFRPTMNRKFEYEHLISVDFACKIRLKH
jgi:hypothetical protein